MARPKLTVYLDIISPFAYMAFYVTKNSPIFKQCDVNYVPIFLGGLMQKCNNRPPIEIKKTNLLPFAFSSSSNPISPCFQQAPPIQ
ncbi:hypothetical protein KC346_g19017 [Hortaea werneckii]|nr:hypothetical protein KC346_g19017 [Hortaea werneckii]